MGILVSDHQKDVEAIESILTACLEDWNNRFAAIEGVHLSVRNESLEIFSKIGGNILEQHFPEFPDAYKRVATLLVLMSLWPFINGKVVSKDGIYTEILEGFQLRRFAIITIVDSVGLFFYPLEQQSENGVWVHMNQWPGFTTEGRKELIDLLYSYAESMTSGLSAQRPEFSSVHLFQAILSVSLVLKNRYTI